MIKFYQQQQVNINELTPQISPRSPSSSSLRITRNPTLSMSNFQQYRPMKKASKTVCKKADLNSSQRASGILMMFHSQNWSSQDRQMPKTFCIGTWVPAGCSLQVSRPSRPGSGLLLSLPALLTTYAIIIPVPFISMRTQIIKVNAKEGRFNEDIAQLCSKFDQTNSDITIIVKPKHIQASPQSNEDSLGNQPFEQFQECKEMVLDKDSICMSQVHKKQSFSESLTRRGMNLDNLEDIEQNFNVCISTQHILPNVIVTEKSKKSKMNLSSQRNQESSRNRKRFSIDLRENSVQSHGSAEKIELREEMVAVEREQPEIPPIKILSVKCPNSEQLQLREPLPQLKQPPRMDHEEPSESSENDSLYRQTQRQSIMESLFVIEDRINDAISFIKDNKLFELEEYLYEFKTRYSNMSDRVQVKWRLLMAYCKENRKEYERAAILYQQVLEMAQAKPKLLLVDNADIHHRLGICYTEARRWNDGILSFANALGELKKNEKKLKYAECLNNLGSLYLTAQKIEQAEQCFLISYEIKKNELGQKSRKLVSNLFNLYECNILIHNYDQAEKLLVQFELILSHLKESDMLAAGLCRRRGKLNFLKGDLEGAETNYRKGLSILTNKYPYSLEYGQLCNNLAIIKLEQQDTEEARELLNTALSRLTFYYTKDSSSILKIKSHLELLEKIEKRGRPRTGRDEIKQA